MRWTGIIKGEVLTPSGGGVEGVEVRVRNLPTEMALFMDFAGSACGEATVRSTSKKFARSLHAHCDVGIWVWCKVAASLASLNLHF